MQQESLINNRIDDRGFSSLFYKAHDGIFRSTPEGKFLEVNPALVKMLGYHDEEELLSIDISQDLFFHPEERPEPTERGKLFVSRLKKKDGSLLWAEINSWVNYDRENDLLYYEGIIREITRHKEMIEDLHNTREELKITLQSIGDGVVVTDSSGQVVMLNEVAENLIGWQQPEARGKPLTDIFNIINEYSREVVKNPVEKVLKTGKIEGLANHTILIARDGSEIPIADSASPIKDQQGKLFGCIMVFRDVSERRKLIKDLRENRNLYKSLFENTGTATVIIAEDHTITMVNKEMEKLSGYRKEEIEGKLSLLDFIIPADREKMLNYHRQRLKGELGEGAPPKRYEFSLKDRKDSIKNVLLTVDLIPGTKQTIASFLDITERKQNEERALYLAYHDELTGLYNRPYLEETLERLDTERQLPISIIMGDINGLKLANDAFGHQKGDQLLKDIARVVQKSCRQEDIIARWGGDEFIILLPGTDEAAAQQVVNRIKTSCNKAQQKVIKPSIALGFSTKSNPEQNIWAVLNEAEEWMYKRKLIESQSARRSIINSLEKTLWEKDFETEAHARRLKNMAVKMGEIIGLPDNKLDDLILLASLHDIGKIAIPNTVLLKPGSFTDEEWATMKTHSIIGYRIAESTPDLAPIAKGILHHHEWWNGTGYPHNLKEKEIPLLARIISIVDAFDVMIHNRPYKKAMSREEAIAELKRAAGIQFDPELVKIFINQVAG